MGFDVNFNKPMIRETQSMQDGGAGNLGYFESGEQKKDKDKSIFAEAHDSFEKSTEDDVQSDFSIAEFFSNLIDSIVAFFKKLFKIN